MGTAAFAAAVRFYIEAVNRGDVEAILALYADDAEIHDPVGQRTLKGKDALRGFYECVAGNAQMTITGPIRGSFAAAVAAPIHASVPGREIDVITVTRFDEGGHIIEYSAYWGPDNVRTVD